MTATSTIAFIAITAFMVFVALFTGKWVPLLLWCIFYLVADFLRSH